MKLLKGVYYFKVSTSHSKFRSEKNFSHRGEVVYKSIPN